MAHAFQRLFGRLQPFGSINDPADEGGTWWRWGDRSSAEDDTWGRNKVVGTKGDDHLVGTAGADKINGKRGADTMVGGLGNDVYLLDDAGDVVTEGSGEGVDQVTTSVSWTMAEHVEHLTMSKDFLNIDAIGNGLDNIIRDNVGDNHIEGGGGDDMIFAGTAITPFNGDTVHGGEGNDHIVSTGQTSNEFHGDAGDDTIESSMGVIHGGAGRDTLTGQRGHDRTLGPYVYAGSGHDHFSGYAVFVDGEDGDDTISTAIAEYVLGGNGDDTITGTVGSAQGGEGDDVIALNLFSARGSTAISGGNGNDHITFSGQPGTVSGDAGDDHIRGDGSSPGFRVDGGEGNDTISVTGSTQAVGGLGNDTISAWGGGIIDGGEGDDRLIAGGERSVLAGGAGSDVFEFGSVVAEWFLAPMPIDFTSGVDVFAINQATLGIGNGDIIVDGAQVADGPGFSADAELVLFSQDVLLDGTNYLEDIAQALGSASADYTAGQTAVFAVGDDSKTLLLRFESKGNDAAISADELSVIATIYSPAPLAIADFRWTDPGP